MVKRFLGGKGKKTLFFKLFIVATPCALLFLPLAAQASFFSLVTSLFERATTPGAASVLLLNSQRMTLLQPAVNLNPNPARGGGDITIVGGSALMAEAGPEGTIRDIEEQPQSSQISVYTVREGDTLSQIAEMFDVSVNTIAWANDIKGRVIHPGDLLVILPITGTRHTVEAGDTLASLAKKYDGDVTDIALYNEINEGAKLAVGTTVIIPNGVVATPVVSGPSPSTPTAPARGTSGPDYSEFYAWPVNGGVVTQGLHGFNGIDIGAPRGTAIFSSAAGVVLVVRNNDAWNGGYGNYVVVQHNNGTQTLYAHATDVLVSVGQTVAQGQTIATIGATGRATGNHVHFEVRGAKNPFR